MTSYLWRSFVSAGSPVAVAVADAVAAPNADAAAAESAAEVRPAAEVGPAAEVHPVVEVDPAAEVHPAAEVGPAAEVHPAAEVGPAAEVVAVAEELADVHPAAAAARSCASRWDVVGYRARTLPSLCSRHYGGPSSGSCNRVLQSGRMPSFLQKMLNPGSGTPAHHGSDDHSRCRSSELLIR